MGPIGGTGGGLGGGGPQNLGAANFTFTVNTQNFTQGLQQAQQAAQQTSQTINRNFKQSGQGLLQLSYIVDDLQYGFKNIVNNIPGLVQGLGLGAGLAGALGVAAVAVNTLANNWDKFKEAFESTDFGLMLKGFAQQAEDAARATQGMKDRAIASGDPNKIMAADFWANNNHPMFNDHVTPEQAARMQQAQAMGKQTALAEQIAAEKKLGLPQGEDSKKRAEEFVAAVSKMGGGEKLVNLMVNAQMAKGGNQNMVEVRKQVLRSIGFGMEGRDMDTNIFGVAFKQALQSIRDGKMLTEQGEGNARMWRAEMKADAELTAKLNKESEAGEKLMKDQIRANIDDLEKQRDEIRERMNSQRSPQIFNDARSFIEHQQLTALNSKKPEVEQLKRIDRKLEEQNRILRQGIPARAM